jgi:protein-disulfide isomerase
MFTSRGQVDGELALQQAAALGLDPETIRARMGDADVDATLAQSFQIAQALEISGTPTFIIGDEIIPGAVGAEVLREKIANMRACGSTQCPS